ncbi:hypothetical protein [Nonomuraea sediminis]|uniref:hypothetical protein n=1 Tax=Nonomuraea sediminis TaxID=2835864 RepID=UPI001BDD06BA|nr:hypothetical protein [Nonomuraea sediminis]
MGDDDKHISSTAIGRTAHAVDLHLTDPLRGFRASVKPQTDLPPGTFGTIGDLILGGAYREFQLQVEQIVADAVTVTEHWQRDLDHARRNWRIAEDLAWTAVPG